MALALCVGALGYTGGRLYGTIGPSRATVAADGRLLLLSHGAIHAFGPDGMRQQSMSLEALGAPARPSDFEVHRDGRIVVTNPDAPELVRCAWPSGPCERVPIDVKSLPAQEVLPLNAAKLHIDDAGGRYFIADNSGHRVIVTDFAGKLQSSTRPRAVQHPNQLSLASPERLAVVDTDRRRIVAFRVSADGVGAIQDAMSTDARGVARPGRFLPFDAVRLPVGEVAVLVAAIGMKNADLVFFDAGGKALRRADLGEDSDPFDVELWRGRLWVADATRYRLDAVALDGSMAPALEDSAFLEELAGERRALEQWRELRRFAQVGLVAIPLLGALLLWKLGADPVGGAKRAPAVAASRNESAAEIHWIDPRAAFLQRLHLLAHAIAWSSLILLIGWIALFMLRYTDHVFSVSGLRWALPMLAAIVAMGVFFFVVYRAIPARFRGMRLGISPDSLHFAIPDALSIRRRIVTGSAPWKDVYHDGKRLLIGEHLLLTSRFPFGSVFDGEDLARLVGNIPGANIVGAARLGRLALAASARLRLALIAWIAIAAALAARELARHL